MSRITPAAALSAVAIFALTACGTPAPADEPAATAPLLRIGSLQEPTGWDPSQSNEAHQIPFFQAVYDSILKREPDGSLAPMLATEWTTSDDGLVWTFDLRDDVTFTDGAVFDAEAAKANLDHFKAANGPFASNLGGVESVDVVDDDTFTVTLKAPDPSLGLVMSGPAGFMASPEALEAGITTEPVGSGPYVLDTAGTVVGSTYGFDRNDDYWGDQLPFDRVEFTIYTDETARVNALRSGQVDAAVLQRVSSATEADGAGLTTEPQYRNWEGIIFGDRDGTMVPELAERDVRQALCEAIDREAILDVVALGRAELTSQVFREGTEGFDPDLQDAYQYDPEHAEELLADARATGMALTLPQSPVFDPAIYGSIAQNWSDIGVTVGSHQWGPGEAVPSMQNAEFPVFYMALGQRDDWRAVRQLVAPTAPWNPFGTERDEVNELIEQIRTGDEEELATAARALNEYLVEEYWFCPVMRMENLFYWNASVVDVELQTELAVPAIYNYRPAE
jgi:peptide/nickel transport system substrate-binding protein